MNAVTEKIDLATYVSDRVFDGIRKVTDPDRAAGLRARVETSLAGTKFEKPTPTPKA